jgi:hypothetical protein
MKTLRCLIIVAIIATVFAACSYATTSDERDAQTNSVFSPGYVNYDSAVHRAIKASKNASYDDPEKDKEKLASELGSKVTEASVRTLAPDVKNKDGRDENLQQASASDQVLAEAAAIKATNEFNFSTAGEVIVDAIVAGNGNAEILLDNGGKIIAWKEDAGESDQDKYYFDVKGPSDEILSERQKINVRHDYVIGTATGQRYSISSVVVNDNGSLNFGVKQTLSDDEQQTLLLNTYWNTDLQPYYSAFDSDPARAAQRAAYLAGAIAENTRPGGYIMNLVGNNVQMATAMAEERTRVYWASVRRGYATNQAWQAAEAYVAANNSTVVQLTPVRVTNTNSPQNLSLVLNNNLSPLSPATLRDNSNSNSYGNYNLSPSTLIGLGGTGAAFTGTLNNANIGSILRGLMANRGDLAQTGMSISNEAMVGRAVTDTLGATLALPVGNIGAEDMQAAITLANILENPTADQQAVISAVEGLLTNMGSEGELSVEAVKAKDQLLSVVASILMAQAVPDLLKSGDVNSIKGMFSELGAAQNQILKSYNESVKPYYEGVEKMLTSNQTIMSRTMPGKEKLERSDIEKIIKELQDSLKKGDISPEEKQMLDEIEKLRKDTLAPEQKKLAAQTKGMMESFTKQLSSVLESAKPAKK